MKDSDRGSAVVFLSVAVAILVIALAYVFLREDKIAPQAAPEATSTSSTTVPTESNGALNATWKSYTSNALNITFKYPADWSVDEGNKYPGSAQGNDEVRITKGSELIYASTKRDCLENYTVCKGSTSDSYGMHGYPYFSTQSTNQATKDTLDGIIKTVVPIQ